MKYITLGFLAVFLIAASLAGSLAIQYYIYTRAWGLTLVRPGAWIGFSMLGTLWSLSFVAIWSGFGQISKKLKD